jgi:hypothetical protein
MIAGACAFVSGLEFGGNPGPGRNRFSTNSPPADASTKGEGVAISKEVFGCCHGSFFWESFFGVFLPSDFKLYNFHCV